MECRHSRSRILTLIYWIATRAWGGMQMSPHAPPWCHHWSFIFSTTPSSHGDSMRGLWHFLQKSEKSWLRFVNNKPFKDEERSDRQTYYQGLHSQQKYDRLRLLCPLVKVTLNHILFTLQGQIISIWILKLWLTNWRSLCHLLFKYSDPRHIILVFLHSKWLGPRIL